MINYAWIKPKEVFYRNGSSNNNIHLFGCNSKPSHSKNVSFFGWWVSIVYSWAQFHQRSTYSFYARRSRMRKKRQSSHQYHLALLGPTSVKAARRTLMKLTPSISMNVLALKEAKMSPRVEVNGIKFPSTT